MPASRILFSLPSRSPTNQTEVPLADVSGADDLPTFLIAGQLDRAGFKATDTGWQATWRNQRAGLAFSLDWHRDRHEASFEATAPHIPPLFGGTTGATLGKVMRQLAPSLPNWLRRAVQPRLESLANLRVLNVDAPEIVTVPSRPLTVLALPMPLVWLDEFVDWHREARLDNRVGARCLVHVCECDSRVHYRDRSRIPLQSNRRLSQIFAGATGQSVDLRVHEQTNGQIAVAVDRR